MQAQCVERTDRLYNGELRFEMSDAEFRVAKEQPAIHTMNAPKDLTDSNMKFLNRDAGNAAPGASWWELRDLVNTGCWFVAFP